jgi:UDP-N-acetyl-2-amino-2-deoxyglucuronate dehydrogenase
MTDAIGIGIIGCGNVARIHAQAILRVESLKLVSVCSRSTDSAEKMGREFGTPYHTNLDEFLSDPKLAAVSICAPSGLHAEIGCRAARAGKHVLVEKPIDVNLENADALIEACRAAAVKLGITFQSRFLDATREIHGAVQAGRLGGPVMGSAYVKWYRGPEYYGSAAWRGTLALDGGGALINQSIHTVDLLQWTMGPVAEVAAFSSKRVNPQIEGEDTLVAALRFRNGALGVVEAATSAYPGFKRRLEITGTEGTVVLEGDNIVTWALRDKSPNPLPPVAEISDGSGQAMAISNEGHRRIMQDFAEAIRDNRPAYVDGLQGRRSLELVLAIYRSAVDGGRPVILA